MRLYLANRCSCTGSVGARVFDVDLNGQPWINDEDLVADVGDQTGTMKDLELNAPASGVITITFLHQTENTLVNGIEIVRTDITPPTTNVLYRVNAGGPAIQSLDDGANWRGDEAFDSPLRNSGSNTAGWSPVSSFDATVPASTPSAIFDTERWDPGDGDEMSRRSPSRPVHPSRYGRISPTDATAQARLERESSTSTSTGSRGSTTRTSSQTSVTRQAR